MISEEEIRHCKTINAEYMLFHFPKPMILNDNLNWNHWIFRCDNERLLRSQYPYKVFEENCERMFDRLSSLSAKYDMQVVLENDIINEYIYATTLLERLVNRYPDLKICLDIGRLHLLEKTDKGFDSEDFVSKMTPYTFLVHLSNARIENNSLVYHIPALPHLKISEGWADIEGYLRNIFSINRDVKVLFEHRSDLISDLELEECYKWVGEIVTEYLS